MRSLKSIVFMLESFSMRASFRERAQSRYAIAFHAFQSLTIFARFLTIRYESYRRYSQSTSAVPLSKVDIRSSSSLRAILGKSIRLYLLSILVNFSCRLFSSFSAFSAISTRILLFFQSLILSSLRDSVLSWHHRSCCSLIWSSDCSSWESCSRSSHLWSKRRYRGRHSSICSSRRNSICFIGRFVNW